MCLARIAFVSDRGKKGREILTDVARIDLTSSGLNVADLTGTVSQIAGKIQSIDFIESVVWIDSSNGSLESAL